MSYVISGEMPKNNDHNNTNRYKFLKVGKVTRVDRISMVCDVDFLDEAGSWPSIPISSAYWSPSAFIGSIPEVGCLVLLGFRQAGVMGQPVILTYMPNMVLAAQKGDPIEKITDSDEIREIRSRFRNIAPGEILLASSAGTDVIIDEGFKIYAGSLAELELDDKDNFIKMTSTNNNIFTNAGIITNGMICRNELLNTDEFKKLADPALIYLGDGSPCLVVNTSNKSGQQPYGGQGVGIGGTEAFTEYRIEVRETSDGNTTKDPITKHSGDDDDVIVEKPLVQLVLGTTVGNDAVSPEGKKQYGKILAPRIFKSPQDNEGDPAEYIVNNVTSAKTIAGAYQLKFPNTKTAITYDKQGVLHMALAASTGESPLGSGKSANIVTDGNIKAVLGQDNINQNSLDLVGTGGFKWNLGGNVDGNSLDLTLRKGYKLKIVGQNNNRFAYEEEIFGNVSRRIVGNRETEIEGDNIYIVHGKHEVRALGKQSENVIGDKGLNFGGSYTKSIIGGETKIIGTGKKTTIIAPDTTGTAEDTLITLGNKNLVMTLGNRTETLVAGNDVLTIGAGNKTVTVGAGNIVYSVGTGNFAVNAPAGAIALTGTSVSITGSASFSIAAPTANISSLQTLVGSAPTNPVLLGGPLSPTRCYITGLPYLGSTSFFASL